MKDQIWQGALGLERVLPPLLQVQCGRALSRKPSLRRTLKRARSRRQFLHGSAPSKVEELLVEVRPTVRGFRYGGNIRLSKTPKLLNCDALEVYVDAQRFTLYPGSDMEVQAGATARMEVEPTGRSSQAAIESVLCTFYGKP